MAKYLLVGDSQNQGGYGPGYWAEQKLKSLGHTVRRIAHHGMGPIDYTTTPALWNEYTTAVRDFAPTAVILIYGSNDFGDRLDDALLRMKNAVRPPVWLSGPPRYPDPARDQRGAGIRAINQRVFGDRWIDAYPYTPLSIPRDDAQAHFPGAGARPWGEAIVEAVLRAQSPLPSGHA